MQGFGDTHSGKLVCPSTRRESKQGTFKASDLISRWPFHYEDRMRTAAVELRTKLATMKGKEDHFVFITLNTKATNPVHHTSSMMKEQVARDHLAGLGYPQDEIDSIIAWARAHPV